jgi:hypothetical protein
MSLRDALAELYSRLDADHHRERYAAVADLIADEEKMPAAKRSVVGAILSFLIGLGCAKAGRVVRSLVLQQSFCCDARSL